MIFFEYLRKFSLTHKLLEKYYETLNMQSSMQLNTVKDK